MKSIYFFITVFLLFIISSCKPEFEEFNASAGNADFSKYVALGNSLTAGYADGALCKSGQEASYPAIIAQQLEFAGVGDFSQPLMEDNVGGLLLNGTQITGNRLVLAVDDAGNFGPAILLGSPTTEITTSKTGPFSNMAIPGAKTSHLLAPNYGSIAGILSGSANPYYARFATSETASVLEDAMLLTPTFFSLWIGNNDVLGYATSGGDGSDPMTPVAGFTNYYKVLINTLTSNGAKGVVANIPYVSDIPFFTTVPYNPLSSDNPDFANQIPILNTQFSGLNQIFDALGVPERKIVFNEEGLSALVIKDDALTNIGTQITTVLIAQGQDADFAALMGFLYGQARQINEDELVLLTASSIIAKPNEDAIAGGVIIPPELTINGITYPLENKWILTKDEITDIKTTVDAYNEEIKTLATNNNLAFVDANSFFADFKNGVKFDGVNYTTTYVTGGLFSLDGVHPNPRGYAIIANEFITAINTKYNASVSLVNVNDYDGVIFP